jgi:Flp pilus assembly protein TadG
MNTRFTWFRRMARPRTGSHASGQSLVEFALVIPIFLVLLMGLIEFAFLMNGQLSINYATRDAALVAAEAGNATGADCVILQKVEQDVSAPANSANISQVQIFWTNADGQPLDTSGNITTFGSGTQAADTYTHTGTTTCTFADGTTLIVPYSLSGTAKYPTDARCSDVLGTTEGCQAGHPGIDTIGVKVTYFDSWRTPLHNLLGMLGTGWTVIESNQMRMEPVL